MHTNLQGTSLCACQGGKLRWLNDDFSTSKINHHCTGKWRSLLAFPRWLWRVKLGVLDIHLNVVLVHFQENAERRSPNSGREKKTRSNCYWFLGGRMNFKKRPLLFETSQPIQASNFNCLPIFLSSFHRSLLSFSSASWQKSNWPRTHNKPPRDLASRKRAMGFRKGKKDVPALFINPYIKVKFEEVNKNCVKFKVLDMSLKVPKRGDQ